MRNVNRTLDPERTPSVVRLKRVRNLANLSRKQLCETSEININTLKGWEIGRYGGLPVDGAERVVARVLEEGVLCTVDWLIYEDGPGPRLITTKETSQEAEATDQAATEAHKSYILEEISLFTKHYHDTIHYKIADDGMAPRYNIGDYVAGVKRYGADIDALIGQDCIVQLADGRILLRHLKKDPEANTYTLLCTNLDATVSKPAIYYANLILAAPVTQHYYFT